MRLRQCNKVFRVYFAAQNVAYSPVVFSSQTLDHTFSSESIASMHFENLNMHLMSYDILINFVNTQWPDLLKLWQLAEYTCFIIYSGLFLSNTFNATEIVVLKHSLQSACMLHYVPCSPVVIFLYI